MWEEVVTESIYSQCIQCSISQPNIQSARQSSQALNQPSHTCELNTHKIIHHTEISILAKPALLDDTSHQHHQQLGGCERKLCLIPNWDKQTAHNTEGSFWNLEEILFIPHWWDSYPSGCTMGALSAGLKRDKVYQSEEAGKASQITWVVFKTAYYTSSM